jgi:AmmeMemoRadiSam system protein A
MHLGPESSRAILDLARRAIRAALNGERVDQSSTADAGGVADELAQRAGCFVSLHEMRTHRLRGCVGRLEADEPLNTVVPKVAESCLRDPRFEHCRIRLDDLPRLLIEVTVLSPLRSAADPLDFSLLEDGIVLTLGEVTGCFLPQVARETGWSKEQLLSRLAQEKLGLPPDAWTLPQAKLQKFSTLLIGPEPFEVV